MCVSSKLGMVVGPRRRSIVAYVNVDPLGLYLARSIHRGTVLQVELRISLLPKLFKISPQEEAVMNRKLMAIIFLAALGSGREH